MYEVNESLPTPGSWHFNRTQVDQVDVLARKLICIQAKPVYGCAF